MKRKVEDNWRGVTVIARPELQQPEAKGPKRGRGSWKGGSEPPPPATGSGERCKLPQRGPGHSPGCPTVILYFKCSRWLLLLHY